MPNTEDFIGVVIADVARLLRTAFDRRVRKLGITRAQWLVLTRVHRHPGASQSQDGDRRVKRVYLTAEAERVHRRIWRVAEETLDDALADLSAREGAQLRALL